jgi:hypothetical protein
MNHDLRHVTHTNAPPPPAPLTRDEIFAYLDYAADTLQRRRDDLVATLTACAQAYATLPDPETAGEVAENIRMAAALGRTIEEHRKAAKAPFWVGGKAVDTWFQQFCAPLAAAMAPVQAVLDAFGRRLEAEQRAEAEARRQAALASADHWSLAAADAIAEGAVDSALLDRAAATARAAAEAIEQAEARPADLSRVRGVYGSVASLRETWGYTVTDLDAVPRAYLMVNDAAVKAAMKQKDSRGRPMVAIPGVQWTATQTMSVR